MLAFHILCKNGNEAILDIMLDKIEPIKLAAIIINDPFNLRPLHLLCSHKIEKYISLKKILEIISLNDSAENSLPVEKIFKKEDSERQTILHLAIENNHLKIVDMLFGDYKISSDLREGKRGNQPIHLCAKNGTSQMFDLLCKHNAVSFKQNNYLENALHIAASANKPHFITEFLKYEYNYMKENKIKNYVPCSHTKDSKQNTPLFSALASSNQTCFKVKSK
jgi:ankyrin repeat protein